jgi:hypothetical protein
MIDAVVATGETSVGERVGWNKNLDGLNLMLCGRSIKQKGDSSKDDRSTAMKAEGDRQCSDVAEAG